MAVGEGSSGIVGRKGGDKYDTRESHKKTCH